MTNRALCVGINDYPLRDMDLRGCVNDAKAWASVLRDHYDFAKSDVTLMVDRDATHETMLAGVKDLVTGTGRGDVIVFTNSSHGTYRADGDDEEADRYDEAMCPYDCKQNLLVDDELRTVFAEIPWGVRCIVISDSCHSGSVTRLAPGMTPDDRRPRFLDPKKLKNTAISDVRRAEPRGSGIAERDMRELLISGCRSDQYSYDARFGRKYHGAMTFHALKVLEEHDYRISYNSLVRKLGDRLREDDFPQEPQLEGRTYFKRQQVFT